MTALGLTLALAPAAPEQAAPEQGATSRLLIPLVRLEQQAPVPACEEVLTPWRKLVEDSLEACLVLDAAGDVVAASTAAAELLGEYGPDQVVGHPLLDVLDLVDFHGGAAGAVYADRIAPMLALTGNTLARGLLRVRLADGGTRTLDAIAAPLHDPAGEVAGVVAFLASIWT